MKKLFKYLGALLLSLFISVGLVIMPRGPSYEEKPQEQQTKLLLHSDPKSRHLDRVRRQDNESAH